ncbi:dUTP diphosphatase [Patescibacteria group bacterium]|nr:dUTP diphosphatase [Patescibacteria group bacterium]MBU1613516.1 dUTP diphosphatase [Patescibacteria group bacterium]
MKLKIKRIDHTLPLPEYKTQGAVAFDLYAREKAIISAHGWYRVPSNFIMEIPEGHALVISARSSLAKHFPGLFLANGIGLIDCDYRGPNDEIAVSLYNFSDTEHTIEKGTRLAQAFVVKTDRCEIEEIQEITSNDRGGFGSTGK